MIYGIGTDICDIRRIRAVLERHGEAFAKRILGDAEIEVWRTHTSQQTNRGVRYLATRFCAKEAFSKAVGLGMRWPMTWRGCEIVNLASGKPSIQLQGELLDWFETRSLKAHVSLSDEVDYAVSFVLIERAP